MVYINLGKYEGINKQKTSSINFGVRYTNSVANLKIRAYFSHFGFDLAYRDAIAASSHLSDTISKHRPTLLSESKFTIAALWGDDSDKMIDLFSFSDYKGWPGNPGVTSYIFRNGVYEPEEHEISCGDMVIVLGLEESHRRKSSDLESYFNIGPEIEGLEFISRE